MLQDILDKINKLAEKNSVDSGIYSTDIIDSHLKYRITASLVVFALTLVLIIKNKPKWLLYRDDKQNLYISYILSILFSLLIMAVFYIIIRQI